MKCPYDPTHENTAKPSKSGFRYYAKCENCGKKAVVIIHSKVDERKSYELAKVGASKVRDAKKVRTIRLSDSEMKSIESGRLKLVVSNNRITITV